VNAAAFAGLALRAAAAFDIPAIAAIYAREVERRAATWEIVAPDVLEMRARFESIVGAGYPYLVAAANGRVAGYAYASAYRTRPGYRFTVEDSVYVAEDMQGKGVGRALLAALIEACTVGGARQMVAVIGGADNAASIRLHAAQGFVEVGRLPAIGRKLGRWLDCLLMQRALGEGATTAPQEDER
jgi:phosphinothricin acetyltransferase